MVETTKTYDILAIGAHPDDVEVGVGGVLIRMREMGYRTGIVYLTQGEMGTGGTIKIRRKEAEDAARVMGADLLARHDLGDTKIFDTYKNRSLVARVLRKYRPRIVLAPHWDGHTGRRQSHADHIATGRIVLNAANLCRLKKFDRRSQPHEVRAIFHYFIPLGVTPTFVVDITDWYDRWLKALKAHRSQFLNPKKTRDYLWSLETMARSFGALIGVKYAQGFVSSSPLHVGDLFAVTGPPRKTA
jgi:bacillithiol biosynthesis deacetylase BshB1